MRGAVIAVLALAGLAACSGGAAPLANTGHSAAPASDAALALFEPSGRDCTLLRVDPIAGTRDVLVTLPTACAGARVAWRADRTRAVVWFDPGNAFVAGFALGGSTPPGHPIASRDSLPASSAAEGRRGSIEQVKIEERLYDVERPIRPRRSRSNVLSATARDGT